MSSVPKIAKNAFQQMTETLKMNIFFDIFQIFSYYFKEKEQVPKRKLNFFKFYFRPANWAKLF